MVLSVITIAIDKFVGAIVLPNVNGSTLKIIHEFLTNYAEYPLLPIPQVELYLSLYTLIENVLLANS